jgi:hypothetical protein
MNLSDLPSGGSLFFIAAQRAVYIIREAVYHPQSGISSAESYIIREAVYHPRSGISSAKRHIIRKAAYHDRERAVKCATFALFCFHNKHPPVKPWVFHFRVKP